MYRFDIQEVPEYRDIAVGDYDLASRASRGIAHRFSAIAIYVRVLPLFVPGTP